jgi:uncharacterized protein YceK
MRNLIFLLIFVGTLLFTSGCASIMSGTSQSVSVQTEPDSAKATFLNRKGEAVSVQQTPCVVSLKRSEQYRLKLEKENYQPLEGELKKGLNGWYLGNVFFGGVLGFLIIDPGTGAMWSYDDTIRARLESTESKEISMFVEKPRSVQSKPVGKNPYDQSR